jgi:hypothetical protein
MNVKQLQAKARQLNIAGRSKMNKTQLQEAIAAAQANVVTVEDASHFLGTLTKGEARRWRKKMFAEGRRDLSAAPRIVAKAVRKAA